MELFDKSYQWFISESNVWIGNITLPILLGLIYKCIIFILEKIKTNRIEKSLFPYYTRGQIIESQKKYIRTKCQNIDPANEISLKHSFAFATREDLLHFFLRKVFKVRENENRFYLILADSGMGKTTFMLNLFVRFQSFLYINFNSKKIKLIPLGEDFDTTKKTINAINIPSETILLLDGFDEIPTVDNGTILSKFDELIELVKEFSTVLITCRTHFFSSEQEEPFELKIKKFTTAGNGYHILKKIYISPFDDKDISKYINKTFRFYDFYKKSKADDIVGRTNDLFARPMLLSYIKEILTLKDSPLETNFDIYEALIFNWIKRETNKYPKEKQLDFKLNLIYFSYAASDYIYKNYKKNGLFIPLLEATKLSNSFNINLSDIEIKSRSLLNRNSKGDYKFSHKSIYEFFLAYNGYDQRVFDWYAYTIKYNLDNYDVAKKFTEDIILSKRVDFLLPVMKDKFIDININKNLYKKILDERNKDTEVVWASGNTFFTTKRK